MNAVVVYESHWGNTETIARAIAEGIGPEARALVTDEATPEVIAEAELVVAGAPVMAFRLPTDGMAQNAALDRKAPVPADVSHPTIRAWLEQLPEHHGFAAAFETRLRWSPGGATGAIDHGLEQAGFKIVAKPEKFVVTGAYGPLRDGETERARAWGAALAKSIG
jgi:hypothetical protein